MTHTRDGRISRAHGAAAAGCPRSYQEHYMIFTLVGADGAGKSTVSRTVTERLRASGLPVDRVDRWDIVDNPAYPAARFMRPDVPDARQCVAEMPEGPRFLFLMWSIGMALEGRVPGPGDAGGPTPAGRVTLLDGYWMKHAASEIVYGLDRTWVEAVVAGLPPAGTVAYLRADPEAAWERKAGRDVLPYECGMDPSCSRESFLAHQRSVLALLDTWADRFGWLTLDASAPLQDVTARVSSLVLDTTGGTLQGAPATPGTVAR
ncbi:thymidylate kinase [Streptomyces sp. KLMMK]|uniref:thymidylate kinase n=1 Tax=Streptomyces sp. KLMMK TaxID=3109353 RepID=UPI003009D8F0